MSRFKSLEIDSSIGSPALPQLSDESALLQQAKLEEENGEFQSALRAYSKVLEFAPANPVAWMKQPEILLHLDDFVRANAWVDKALEKFPNHPRLLATKARIAGRLDEFEAALAFSDASLEQDRQSGYAWLARAEILAGRNDKAASPCYEEAASRASEDFGLATDILRSHLRHDQASTALSRTRQWMPLFTSQPYLWFLLAECQRRLGLVQAARDSLSQSLQLNPRGEAARAALSEMSGHNFVAAAVGRVRGWFKK